tara:strand:- start:51720 stop:52757 length:1038 start_codon:yes stop_codon:yes gene_type:complete
MDYKTSGVDVEAGRDFVNKIKSNVESTHGKEVIGGLGGFGGCFRIPEGLTKPILVAGTDGVGTKLEMAQRYSSHSGVGIDLVAMCVNDVITSGAQPLFFLDYIATGVLSPEVLVQVVNGIAEGCKISNCSLLGGETAEMPGFYKNDKYDLAGFCVGVVEENKLINGRLIQEGDNIIGIASSGIHSNGFSLVRKVLSMSGSNVQLKFEQEEEPLIKTLLAPTTIYAPLVKGLMDSGLPIHGMSHITGGGLPENLPRCFPKGFTATIDPQAWKIPEVFRWLQNVGKIPERDLWNTFNLGIGFCFVVSQEVKTSVIKKCIELGFQAWDIGQVEKSSTESVELTGLPFK